MLIVRKKLYIVVAPGQVEGEDNVFPKNVFSPENVKESAIFILR